MRFLGGWNTSSRYRTGLVVATFLFVGFQLSAMEQGYRSGGWLGIGSTDGAVSGTTTAEATLFLIPAVSTTTAVTSRRRRVDLVETTTTIVAVPTTTSPTTAWSHVKLAVYMTTHLSSNQLRFFPCWHDAIQRLQVFHNADLILYTSAPPTHETLAYLRPFQNIRVQVVRNRGYQQGAIRAMTDPFRQRPEGTTATTTTTAIPPAHTNETMTHAPHTTTWFDTYDWVIRLNPDVLIRNDTWLMETMLDPGIDAIFHDCNNNRRHHTVVSSFKRALLTQHHPTHRMHSDFVAFRPHAVNRTLLLQAAVAATNAEQHITDGFGNIILDSKRYRLVEGAENRAGDCRIEGKHSPVVHSHTLWKECPYYYNATDGDFY
jgi:hypothetical protein